jgi:hypothetical protein
VEQWEYDANNNPISVKHDENGDGVFENAKTYKWQRFATLGIGDIYANDYLFPSYDGEWRVNNTSEDGWEAALLASGTAVGLSLPPSSLAPPEIPLSTGEDPIRTSTDSDLIMIDPIPDPTIYDPFYDIINRNPIPDQTIDDSIIIFDDLINRM